ANGFVCLGLDLLDHAGTPDSMPLGRHVTSCGNPTTLTGDGRSTGRVRLLRTATYTVRVQGENDYVAQGPYRAWIYPINRAADSVSSVVMVGETISGDAVDPPGDVDEFTFAGTAGQEVAVFLQSRIANGFVCLVLELLNPDGRQLRSVTSCGNPPTLEGQSTGPVVLPGTAAYTVRVRGADDYAAGGPYRFQVRALN